MSKLKLKKVKEIVNCGVQLPKNVKNNLNPGCLQRTKSLQHLFVDNTPSECAQPNKRATRSNVIKTDDKTSKYFITSSLPEESSQLDESEVEFQPDKRPKRKAVTPKKEVKRKNKPPRKKVQKDIRDVMNSKKDDLVKYTQQFEKECTSAGIDVNPEHLQLAIALSRSITDFQKSDYQNNEDFDTQNTQVELTRSQEKVFEQKRIKQIRKTLDEFGFKVQRTSGSTHVTANVKRKQIKKRRTNYPLLTRSQGEKTQRISDTVSQILFESVSTISNDSYSPDNIPSSIYLNNVWCDCSCMFTKSGHSYKDIKDDNVYYTSSLVTPSKSDIGCLLRDWNSIPGREKSPERDNHSLDFRESEIFLNNFDTLLSGTYSMISAQSSKRITFDLNTLNTDDNFSNVICSLKSKDSVDLQSNSQIVEDIFNDTSRCSSPDIFGDDSYTGDVFLTDNQKFETVNHCSAIVVNDSSDDDLPRIYITRSQKEVSKPLANISEECNAEILNNDCKNTDNVSDSKILEKSVDLTQDNSENSLTDQDLSNSVGNNEKNQLDLVNDPISICKNTTKQISFNKIHEESFDLTQDDSENSLSHQNTSAIDENRGDCFDLLNVVNDPINICQDRAEAVSIHKESFDLTQNDSESSLSNKNYSGNIDEGSDHKLDSFKDGDDKETPVDVIHNVERGESILNTSENIDVSGVYEGRNGIMHYESFQTSPVSSNSIRKSHNYSYKSEVNIDNSSDNSDEDMFERTQKRDISFNNLNISNIERKTVDFPSVDECIENLQTSPDGIDLTQSSKDSDTPKSPSYSTDKKDTKIHVSRQSMLVAHRLSFSVNSTTNFSMSSIDSNEVLKCYNEVVQKSPKNKDKTMSPEENYSNVSMSYSIVDNKHASNHSLISYKISPVINRTNLSVASIDKSQNELSGESSACNDVFIISDEEFNYSMSIPYNKKDDGSLKKKLSIGNKNCTVSKDSSDLSEEKNNRLTPRMHEGSTEIIDNNTYGPAYNLNLCGSSLFDRIPSCNSTFLSNLTENNSEDKRPDEYIEYSKPSTSKNDTTFNNCTNSNRNKFKIDKQFSFLGNDAESTCNAGDVNRISAIIGAVTPDNNKYLIETSNVTPAQDFNKMDTPDMLKELSRFGLKPLKRKRAVQLLEHIYNETHPKLPTKLPPEKKRRRLKIKDDFSASTPSQCEPIISQSDERNCPEHIEGEQLSQSFSGQINTVEKSFESYDNIESGLGEDSNNIYVPNCERITIKQMNCDPDDWIFQNREKTKVHGCRVPLHIAFHNYLSVRNKLRDAILCYEPVNIDTIHRGLVSEGYRYNTKDLFHFMDKKCITIKTTDKNVATKQLKKR